MSDYTPTTEQVREGYSHDPEAEYHDPITNHAALNRQAFNRWLAEHDAEVARAERESIAGLLKAHIYNQSIYLCSCQNNDDYPNTMDVDGWAEHVALIKGENND